MPRIKEAVDDADSEEAAASSAAMTGSPSSASASQSLSSVASIESFRGLENHIDFVALKPPPVFTELMELTTYADGFQEWKEIGRWIKYEETVEVEGKLHPLSNTNDFIISAHCPIHGLYYPQVTGGASRMYRLQSWKAGFN